MSTEIDNISRQAIYSSGSGTAKITFQYVVQPGDMAIDGLDYYTDRAKLLSSVSSFQYNGGTIKQYSNNPTADVFIYLNPPGGSLSGTTSITSVGGVFSFLDLAIRKRGNDYLMRSSAKPDLKTLYNKQIVFVSFSNEFELLPTEAQKFDLIGSSVALSGSIAIIGAPATNISVTAIQTISTKAANPFFNTNKMYTNDWNRSNTTTINYVFLYNWKCKYNSKWYISN
jgi:hypothetical protein